MGTAEGAQALADIVRRPRRFADAELAAVFAGERFLVLDGAMGTQLQAAGLAAGELPELLCITDPAAVTAVHAAYVAAGSEAVTTNTFGANAAKLGDAARVEEVFAAAVGCARASGARYVAADIGPTGQLLAPMGALSFDDAYELFAEQARAADAAGADLFIIETMADILEAKAALLAVREHSDLPAIVTMTFGEDGRTFLGTAPETAAATLDALGADAMGVNCSLGPAEVAPLLSRMIAQTARPVAVQANAGLPSVVDGRTVYSIAPEDYARAVAPMLDAGATIVGGCCGTTPDYIRLERELICERTPAPRTPHDRFTLTSAQTLFSIAPGEVGVIGERINPTGKKRLKQALAAGELDYIAGEAIAQEKAGAQVLDVNVGLPELDERAVMLAAAEAVQQVSALPLQIDSADPAVIEAVVRRYPGKALINSCNGKREVLDAVLPIAARYGCAVIGLTLDEDGIPATAEGRLSIAQRIVDAAERWGIPRRDVAIDCLAMAASTDQTQPRAILDAIAAVKRELPGVRCVLGVSNVSFGLPLRPLVNATFLAAAFAAGLDLAIMNPLDVRMADVVASWRVLSGEDESAQSYIAAYAGRSDAAPAQAAAPAAAPAETSTETSAQQSIPELVVAGRKEPVAAAVSALLSDGDPAHDAMHVINELLIPALDEVGERFEKGVFFLPQLMASAEAAKAGFDVIRAAASDEGRRARKGPIVLCTVKGDIHDIGKNIVRMLLENYGYEVIDLGRDVAPEAVVEAVQESGAKLAGLSALMTTTVAGMTETIELLREQAPEVKIMVGGAVLNEEYARMVGADYYAKDATEATRIAAELLG